MKRIAFLLLSTLYSSLFTSLYAIEGNEPVPKLELIPPKEETLKVGKYESFSRFSIRSEFGENEIGKGGRIELGLRPGINSTFNVKFLKIDTKNSIGLSLGLRNIGTKSIIEVDGKAGQYKIENTQKYFCINNSLSLFIKENIFKILGSGCYESEFLWDGALLWGRNPYERLFIGLGISTPNVAPFEVAPLIQLNWMVNNYFSINTSYKSKEVTKTLESVYMNQPYVHLNPDLKHEQWNSLSTVKLLFQDDVSIEIIHKEIDNIILWEQNSEFVKPINGKKLHEWGGSIDLKWRKIKNVTSFTYTPLEIHPNPPDCVPNYYYFIPTISFTNTLEIPLFFNIEIGLENKYTERKFYFEEMDVGTMSNYWLFSLLLSKKMKYGKIWLKLNNLTRRKYEIIKGVEGPGACIQVGFKIGG